MFPILTPPSYIGGMREANAYTSDLQNMLMNKLAQQHEATNLQYLSPLLAQQLKAAQLANQVTGAQAPFAGPLAQAQLAYLKNQGNLLGLEGEHLSAGRPYWANEAQINHDLLKGNLTKQGYENEQQKTRTEQFKDELKALLASQTLTNKQKELLNKRAELENKFHPQMLTQKAAEQTEQINAIKEANRRAYEERLQMFGPGTLWESIKNPKLWWKGGDRDYRENMQRIALAQAQAQLQGSQLSNAANALNLSYQPAVIDQNLAEQAAKTEAIPANSQAAMMNAITNHIKQDAEHVLPRYINNPSFNELMQSDPLVANAVRASMTKTALQAGQLAGTPLGAVNNFTATMLPTVAANPNKPITNDELDDMIRKLMPGISDEKLREVHNKIVESIKAGGK